MRATLSQINTFFSLFTITFIESSPDAVSISREKIVDLIGANKVVVLSGETGCGKTTQVTIIILSNNTNKIFCPYSSSVTK